MIRTVILFIATLYACAAAGQAGHSQWALTDALGRQSPGYGEVGAERPGKYVGIFYWTWHEGADKGYRIGNITEILREHPEATLDGSHPAWDIGANNYFWDEPLLGYYRTTDKWVLRKHAEMLADAGVDVVFFDCTNGSMTWKDSYEALMECWSEAMRDGVRVPKVCFMLTLWPIPWGYASLRQLYEDVYRPGYHPELWFMWDGKPLIMAYDESIPDDGDPLNDELRSYFTFRPGQPDYVDGPADNRQWGWMEVYPQNPYGLRENGTCEQVPVSVSQNANWANGGHCYAFNAPGTFSRSYTQAGGGYSDVPDAHLYGFNFAEQWERAYALDPDLVFVTGWNEFIAGKHENWPPTNPHKPFAFPDQYDWDRSRDIEPVRAWGEYADIYYCQLVACVRRFKGVAPPPVYSPPVTIDITQAGQWDGIEPSYDHYRGNTFDRSHPGYADRFYTDDSGRNDIVKARVARDGQYVYLHVETAEPLTDPDGQQNWMLLFIDADRDKQTGWEGYDFVVNRRVEGGKASVHRTSAGWNWEQAGTADCHIDGNRLTLRVPRGLLGIAADEEIDIEFKWSDNMQDEGNIIDFYVSGDTAPGGRFNFVYSPGEGHR
ncbi:MAG: hypothetical protein LUE26_01290 [Alistipes sp.]|nr:hypothetical protein [Alistipes sp.]